MHTCTSDVDQRKEACSIHVHLYRWYGLSVCGNGREMKLQRLSNYSLQQPDHPYQTCEHDCFSPALQSLVLYIYTAKLSLYALYLHTVQSAIWCVYIYGARGTQCVHTSPGRGQGCVYCQIRVNCAASHRLLGLCLVPLDLPRYEVCTQQ